MTGHKYFWPTYVWNNPWPDEITVSGLLDKLKFGLENREVDVGYVSQCLLTPTPKFIALRYNNYLDFFYYFLLHFHLFSYLGGTVI